MIMTDDVVYLLRKFYFPKEWWSRLFLWTFITRLNLLDH